MKRIALAIITIALFTVACNKAKVETSTPLQNQSEEITPSLVYQQGDIELEYNLYHNGEQVTSDEGIDFTSETLLTIVTDRINSDHTLGVYYFDNENIAMDFLNGKDEVVDILTNIERNIDLREFAISSGAIDHYETTGEITSEYQTYLDNHPNPNKKKRGLGFLHDNLNMGGASILIGTSPLPVLGGFNNRAESASQIGLGAVIHDRTFFRSPSYYISIGFGPLTYINFNGGLINFMNRTSSTS